MTTETEGTRTMTTIERPPRVLSLTEVAERLRMKRSNVAKFLARRGCEPAFAKAQGYFWWETDIARVKAEREADARRMASDEKRRAAALRRAGHPVPPPPELRRLGRTQRAVLSELLRHPVGGGDATVRHALYRLRERGLVEPIEERGSFQLTEAGRKAASQL